MITILIGAAAVAAGGAAAWLIRRLFRRQGGGDGWSGSAAELPSMPNQEFDRLQAEADRRRAERELAAKENNLRQLLKTDDLPVQVLLQRLGEHRSVAEVLTDPDAIRRLARQLQPDLARVVTLARQTMPTDAIDLATSRDTRPVDYPTKHQQRETLTDWSQIAAIVPEELAADDDTFWTRAATGDLHVVQSYETTKKHKRVYVLLDISSSMDCPMANGDARRVWAMAVVARLAEKAIAGEAEFLLRGFDGWPSDRLWLVTNAQEAKALLDWLYGGSVFVGNHTDIEAALTQAAFDIDQRPEDIATTDVLLLTDGDSPMTVSRLETILGTDKRLHVTLFGQPNEVLEAVAASYAVL
jgi:uncharacterized protein with von Willebrand factor type A (vWA) domain